MIREIIQVARQITIGDLIGGACIGVLMFGLPYIAAVLEAMR